MYGGAMSHIAVLLLDIFREIKFYIVAEYIQQIPCSEANSGSADEQNNPSVTETERLPQYKRTHAHISSESQ
jgi:hypothetical protein